MLTQEELDRFGRQCRHKLLNPDPILADLADVKAERDELARKLAATSTPKPKTPKSAEGDKQ
jgi:hypothetical protein